MEFGLRGASHCRGGLQLLEFFGGALRIPLTVK
jgi:hypothetical protein